MLAVCMSIAEAAHGLWTFSDEVFMEGDTKLSCLCPVQFKHVCLHLIGINLCYSRYLKSLKCLDKAIKVQVVLKLELF